MGVVIPQVILFRRRQVLVSGDDDPMLSHLVQRAQQRPVLLLFEPAHKGPARFELVFRRAAVNRAILNAGAALLLESADSLHEELVDVRAYDGDELHPFEQRDSIVFGLVEHAEVEIQPGQFPVEVISAPA